MSQMSPEVTSFEFFGSGAVRHIAIGVGSQGRNVLAGATDAVRRHPRRLQAKSGRVGRAADRICLKRYNALPADWDANHSREKGGRRLLSS
jgi:hypothetical protein